MVRQSLGRVEFSSDNYCFSHKCVAFVNENVMPRSEIFSLRLDGPFHGFAFRALIQSFVGGQFSVKSFGQ